MNGLITSVVRWLLKQSTSVCCNYTENKKESIQVKFQVLQGFKNV